MQVAVSFEVNISAIGHHFEPSYIADFIYDASGAYGCSCDGLINLIIKLISYIVSSSNTPDLVFRGDALNYGVNVEFSAATNISVEIPANYTCHFAGVLEWFDILDSCHLHLFTLVKF